MVLDLTEDQRSFKESIERFARESIAPHAARIDESGEFPIDLLRASVAHGEHDGVEAPREVDPRVALREVLVLDEPTSQMDPIGTREVFGVIRKMAEQGMTVVLVEHKVEWIAQFADRVIALKDGAILLDGTPPDVLTSSILEQSGFGISRYTSVARKARELGLWKTGRLPVTLDEAVEGFSLALTPSPSLRSASQSSKGRGE